MKVSQLTLALSLASLVSAPLLAQESDSIFKPSVLVELETMKSSNADLYDNTNNDSITDQGSNIELGLEVQISPWLKADFKVAHEVNYEDRYELRWYDALFTIGNPDISPISLGLGKTTVPFGYQDTLMITDPYTLDLGETVVPIAMLSYEAENGLFAKGFIFDQRVNDRKGRTFNNGGFQVGYAKESEERTINAGLGWIANMGGTDGIKNVLRDSDGFNEPGVGPFALGGGRMVRDVPGIALHLMAKQGPITVIGEYMAATRGFDATNELAFGTSGARPAVLHLEGGYTWESGLFGKETTLAAGYQKTWEALDLELPEERISLGLGVEVYKHTTFKLEWARNRAYDATTTGNATMGMAGTGDTENVWTAQVAFEF